jgi:alkylated DNA repair dioxygenase AlkB
MRAPGAQRELFDRPSALPEGFLYRSELLATADEAALVAAIRELPLTEARYRTFTAKRRIASFGAGYDFLTNTPTPAPPLPAFLQPFRERAAAWAGLGADELSQRTVAEYAPGTQLGWHRDAPTFGVVVGISLGAACRMRLRPDPHVKHAPTRTLVVGLEPRSAYVLRGDARWRWQHAISPTKALRWSITFRTRRG